MKSTSHVIVANQDVSNSTASALPLAGIVARHVNAFAAKIQNSKKLR
jgi:hypothetical protein